MSPDELLDFEFLGVSLPGLGLIILALTVLPALWRGARGPKAADRTVAADHVFFVLVASIGLFGLGWDRMLLMDVVLVATLIGFLSALILGRYLGRSEQIRRTADNTSRQPTGTEGEKL